MKPGSPQHARFHKLWSADVDTPGYDKAKWKALERVLDITLEAESAAVDTILDAMERLAARANQGPSA